MVRARFLTPESVIKGIEAGDFYASSGVTLKEVRFSPESKALELEIEPQGDARYTTRFVGTLKGYDPARKPVDGQGRQAPAGDAAVFRRRGQGPGHGRGAQGHATG